MKFLNRNRELRALSRLYEQDAAGLFILFGRRRVGKTRLLTHFLEQQEAPAFYWTATTHGPTYQLRAFSQAVMAYDPRFSTSPSPDFVFGDWERAFHHLADVVADAERPHLIVLDEFTYLLRNDQALASVLQKVWDHRLSQIPQFKLVLTGSLVGMMAREIFSYQAPLYGRATGQIRLRPLPYASLMELFADRTGAERVAIYGVTGGVPAYLELFTRSSDFVTALTDHCLGPGSVMLADPALILHEQLQDPQVYESVLSTVASGFHTWNEIAKMAGVSNGSLGYYLKTLQELELIEQRNPVLSSPTGRKGRYYVEDHFLRFYYRFLVPHITAIERGYAAAAVEKIYADLRRFIGLHVFEELCRQWVWAAAATGYLDFQPEEVGAYWGRHRGKGVQLDVVAVNPRQKRLLIGEAKWGRGDLSRRVLTDLQQRSRRMPQVTDDKWQTQYALFAREGFTAATREAAEKMGALLLTLDQMEKVFLAAEQEMESQ